MLKQILKTTVAVPLLCWSAFTNAAPIVETFESFTSGTIINNQLTGLTVSAANGGNARIATATNPVVAGQPQGLYNDAPGVFSTGFEFALIIDFLATGSSIGAIVDFGVVGTGLMITAYDGVGGTGNVLGSASTLSESFIGVTAAGIKSAVFAQAGASPASWMIDNLTYETVATPEPAAIGLLGAGLLGLRLMRRKRAA